MDLFKKHGIGNDDIAVIVIYDGITKVKKDGDLKENMMTYFNELDSIYKIRTEDRLIN